MSEALDAARYELALANRIIAHEGVLDGFGHVSIRHPHDPSRYLLARSRSPELIEPVRPPRIHAQFGARRRAEGRNVWRAGHSRLHLSGAAGCERGLPSPFGLGAAVLRHRHRARAGLSHGAGDGPRGAVLGQPRRFRRYRPYGGQARRGAFAGKGARSELDGADAPPWRDASRAGRCANWYSAPSIRASMPKFSCARWRSAKSAR